MFYDANSTISLEERELDEFWQDWCLNRLKEKIKEEIQREYAENGCVDVRNLDLHDPTSWLRIALAL